MRKECANEDLPALISLMVYHLSFNPKRRVSSLFFCYCVKNGKKKTSIKLLTEVSKTKTRKYNVLNSAGPNHLSCYDSS